MSVISPLQSHDHEGSPICKAEKLRWWEGFVEKVGFELGVKSEGVMDDVSGVAMMTEMDWEVKEMNRDRTDKAKSWTSV